MTFTQAAGHEMKQRLTEELNTLVSSPIDEKLKPTYKNNYLIFPMLILRIFMVFVIYY